MHNNLNIDCPSPSSYSSNFPNSLKKTEKNQKIESSIKDRFPNFTSLNERTINSVKQSFIEFNQKMRMTVKKILIIFNIIIFNKKFTTFHLFKTWSTPSKQANIFKNFVETSHSISLIQNLPSRKIILNPSSIYLQRIDTIASILKTESAKKAKKKFIVFINKKLFHDVKAMNQSLEKSSEILRQLAEDPAAKGLSVCCQDAIKHLSQVNAELINMHNSVKKVHDDLNILNKLLKKTPKNFDYRSLTNKQKKVFVDVQNYNNNLAQSIGPVKHFFSTDFYVNFGTRKKPRNFRFVKGMTIKMNNPLLNCEITVNSREELRQLKSQCEKSDRLLSAFREDIPHITRFAAEDSFRKVDKTVNYR
jgi:hypothetical protein